MQEKADLIRRLDAARAMMRAVLAEIDAHKEIYPPWTMKEVLAHITGWDDATIVALRAHAGGDEPATPAVRGVDHYNAESVSTRATLDYDHVLREWELAREQLKQVIQELPEPKFAQPMLFPWGRTGTVAQIVTIMVDHEIEHAEEIRAAFMPLTPNQSAGAKSPPAT